jgi:LPXTG-site transpeptidase (sortase) family protein
VLPLAACAAPGQPNAAGGKAAPPVIHLEPTPTPAAITYVAAAPAKPRVVVDYMELPLRLAIPRLGVDAPVISVGLTPQMAMDVPQRADQVGWYEYSTRPGMKGNSVLAGHLDWNGVSGVFRRLGEMRTGDKATIRGANGEERVYTVEWTNEWQFASAPVGTIFESVEQPALTLITCGGRWNPATQRYDTRVVVRAVR